MLSLYLIGQYRSALHCRLAMGSRSMQKQSNQIKSNQTRVLSECGGGTRPDTREGMAMGDAAWAGPRSAQPRPAQPGSNWVRGVGLSCLVPPSRRPVRSHPSSRVCGVQVQVQCVASRFDSFMDGWSPRQPLASSKSIDRHHPDPNPSPAPPRR